MLPEKPGKLKIVCSENKGKLKQKGKINVMKKENKKKLKLNRKKCEKKRKQKYPHGDSNLHYDYLLCKSTAPS